MKNLPEIHRNLTVTIRNVIGRVKTFLVDADNNAFGVTDNPVHITGDFVTEISGDVYVDSIARIQDSDGNDLDSTAGSLNVHQTNNPTAISVDNHPTEMALPAAQEAALTPPEKFGVNEIAEASATVKYIGAETAGGTWWIRKWDTTAGTVFGHATEANNAAYGNYTDAWTNRATLVYGDYSGAF